jgi:DMSO/TMAO reductase YedYZ heme-binding membrane subunit
VLFWLWATRALQEAGVPNRRSVPAAIALLAGLLAVGHVTAYVFTGNKP